MVLPPQPTRREDLLARLDGRPAFDLAVVGGGATGLSVALDAALRGFSVVLLEARDFASGTSSRSTKLLHGGVRYLAQGHLPLVWEALHERATLLRNAPHLAHPLPFVLPCYRAWEKPFYGAGLKLYDALAGRAADVAGLGATEFLNAEQTLTCLPGLSNQGLRGGIRYWDGQFDDARLALALARTAARHGALVLNHCRVTALHHAADRVAGLTATEAETGRAFAVQAKCVVNATGVWVDALRPPGAGGRAAAPLVSPSQGVHLVVDADFSPGGHALLLPRTADGRVLFALPWQGKLVLGTTDTPRDDAPEEPEPLAAEVDFILREAARLLRRPPSRADVRSAWVGLRPLVRPAASADGGTGSISREHLVRVERNGLVSVTGGKWTTCRAMAEDVLARCMSAGLLEERPGGASRHCRLVSAPDDDSPGPAPSPYGTEQPVLDGLPGADRPLGEGLTEAMVRFAARFESARTVEDVLARRARRLFLDARAAAAQAPAVAHLLTEELGRPVAPDAFVALARRYASPP